MRFGKNLFEVKLAGKAVPFNMFCIVGIVVLFFNILLSVFWPFTDPQTIVIFTVGIVLLVLGIVIFRYYSIFPAILLIIVVYNSLIFWVAFHLGRSSGALLYYFPFLVGYLYLFLYNSNLAKTIAQVTVMVIFFAFSLFFSSYRSTEFFLPDHVMERVYLLNLIFSVSATVIILISLYKQFIAIHKSVLNEKEQEHRRKLRELDLESEKKGYALLLSLRDNISQALASSRIYLQMHPEKQEFTRKADEQVKEALNGLNDISVELSPSMLIDFGFKDGLDTYAGLLTDKYGIPITIKIDQVTAEIPEIERLSLYRILQQCINIIASTKSIRFLNVYLKKTRKLSLYFYHDSALSDFSSRFLATGNRDLITRLDYYSGEIKEDKGMIVVDLEMNA